MLTNLSQTVSCVRERWPLAAAGLAVAGLTVASLDMKTATAKTPGSTYCFYGTCHRVKTLDEMHSLVGTQSAMLASFYDSCKVDRYNPCGLTSSGEVFHPDRADNAASPIYPDGTKLLVWSPETKESAVLRVNNAGPYWGPRTLDVSRAAAEALGFKHLGVGKLEVRVLSAPDPHEARYKRERAYDPVPGHLGQFDSVEEALYGATAAMEVQAIATAILEPFDHGLTTSPKPRTPPPTDTHMLVAEASDLSDAASEAERSATAREPKAKSQTSKPVTAAKKSVTRTALAKPSEKKAKRAQVASRKAPAKAAKVAARPAPRPTVEAKAAAPKKPVLRVASAQETTAAAFNVPLQTLQSGKPKRTAATAGQSKTPAKSAKRSTGPARTAATANRGAKKVTAAPAKGYKVSELSQPGAPGLVPVPVMGDRLRLPADPLREERVLPPRTVRARPALA